MSSHRAYRKNGHIFSYPDNKIACDSSQHNGKRLWHNATKKVQSVGEMPLVVVQARNIGWYLTWTFIKSIFFAGIFSIMAGSNFPTQTGEVGFIFFAWTVVARLMSGRWRKLVRIFTEKRRQIETDEFKPIE